MRLYIIILILQTNIAFCNHYSRSNDRILSKNPEFTSFYSFKEMLSEFNSFVSSDESFVIQRECKSSEETDRFKDCKIETNVSEYHSKAYDLLAKSIKELQTNKNNPNIKSSLKTFFNVEPSNKKQLQIILSNMQMVGNNALNTKYKCHEDNKSLWCSDGNLAIVPPPKDRVHLCPAYFNKLTEEQKIATLLHEWFHKWCGREINYFPEKYCYQNDTHTKSNKLIKSADQYMLFIFNLEGSKKLHCF